ncbi:3-keto-5-aminohexanoate cleavage protein [Chloroflexota bacterium]
MADYPAIWNYCDQQQWIQRVGRGKLPPLIVSVAITGGVAGKEINPNLPETPEEQAQSTYDAYNAGATYVHVHARTAENPSVGSTEIEDYLNINRLVREKCPDIIINNTTGGGQGADQSQAMNPVYAKPEVASLDCGPLAVKFTIPKRPEVGRMEDIQLDSIAGFGFGSTEKYAQAMLDEGVKPEIEVWHPGQWWLVQNLIDKGLVKPPYLIQCVMGFQSGCYATPKDLIYMMETAPQPCNLSVIGVGPFQPAMVGMGIMLGFSSVRTGMEDNVYISKGNHAESNAQLVEKVVRMAREFGREIATPQQAREILGLSATPTKYD